MGRLREGSSTSIPAAGGLFGDGRSLVDLLSEHRVRAGGPSLRAIAARIPSLVGERTSAPYLSEIFNGKKIPSGDMAEAIVKALRGDKGAQSRARAYAERAAQDAAAGSTGGGEPEPFSLEPFDAAARPVPRDAAPSLLLSARYRVVEFTGREPELAELVRWRDQPQPQLSIRLMHAGGGHGKTRLAAQFAQTSVGWRAMTARHRSDVPVRAKSAKPVRTASGLLVIVDYAERWPIDDLISFILAQRSHRSRSGPVRVLLLARLAGGWWQGLRAALARHDLTAVDDMRLAPLAPTPDDRREVFRTARACFAEALGVTATDAESIGPPKGLDAADEFGHVLTVHMAALAAVDAFQRRVVAPADAARLSGYLLDRERQHWQWMHRKDPRSDEAAVAIEPSVLARVVFAATLAGPRPYRDAVAVMDRTGISSMAGTADCALSSHTVCYPTEQSGTALSRLLPDRLGEDFVALQTPGHNLTGFTPDPWCDGAITDLLAGTADDRPGWASAALAVLAEAARRWPHLARRHVFPLVRANPHIAIAAGGAVLSTIADLDGVDVEVLSAIAEATEQVRHVDLDVGIAAVAARLADLRLADISDPATRARIYSDLGERLSNAGLHTQAAHAVGDAVTLLRDLAGNARSWQRTLAGELGKLGRELMSTGRYEEALAAAQEAVDLYESVSATLPENVLASGPPAAADYLGLVLARLGRHEEALDTTERAVAQFELMDQASPGSIDAHLAAVLGNYGNRLTMVGRTAEAVLVSERSITIYRRLARVQPGTHKPGLATALSDLALRLRELGQHERALTAVEEAVSIRNQLADLNRAFEAGLADSLLIQGDLLWRLGRHDESIDCAMQEAALWRRAAPGGEVEAGQRLVATLSTLTDRHTRRGHHEQANAAAEEAVKVARESAAATEARSDRTLAAALSNLAAMRKDIGQPEAGLAAIMEAVEIFDRLADQQPANIEDDLVIALGNLGEILEQLGRHEDACPATNRLIEILRRRASTGPESFAPDLALALARLAHSLRDLGRVSEAASAYEYTVAEHRRFAPSSTAYAPGLAMALANLGVTRSMLRHNDQALPAIEEAVDAYRPLAEADPERFQPGLASAMSALALVAADLGDHLRALDINAQAIDMRRALANKDPAHRGDLAISLTNMAALLGKLGRRDEALAMSQEAVREFQTAANREPAHEINLAHALNNLSVELREAGRNSDAVAAAERSATIYRRLAPAAPDVVAPDLHRALGNLAIALDAIGSQDRARRVRQEALRATQSSPFDRGLRH